MKSASTSPNGRLKTRWPCLLEGEAGQLGQEIDAPRRDANLNDHAGSGEVRFGDAGQRRAECGERADDAGRVFASGLDPDVEIAGRPGRPCTASA